MNFVVGPFTTTVRLTHTTHLLRVEYRTERDDGLDFHTGRSLCGKRGVVRSGLVFHRIESAKRKLEEGENMCKRCEGIAERWLR